MSVVDGHIVFHKQDVKSVRMMFINIDVLLADACWMRNKALYTTTTEVFESCREILRLLADIIVILYSPVSCRSRRLVLCFYVKTFLLFSHLKAVNLSKVFHLPLHKLVFHLPDLARRYPFTELLTEDFEGLWKTMRACYRLHNKIMVQEILVISTAVHSTGRILKKISKLLRAF